MPRRLCHRASSMSTGRCLTLPSGPTTVIVASRFFRNSRVPETKLLRGRSRRTIGPAKLWGNLALRAACLWAL
eukprot:4792015-Lingulodinium_polyedra.AAC.1